jgi:hypothetical protein
VIEPEKVKTKKTYTNSGHLVAGGVHVEHHPTLTDVSVVYGVSCLLPAFVSAGSPRFILLLCACTCTWKCNSLIYSCCCFRSVPVPGGRVRGVADHRHRLHRLQRRPRDAHLPALHQPHRCATHLLTQHRTLSMHFRFSMALHSALLHGVVLYYSNAVCAIFVW